MFSGQLQHYGQRWIARNQFNIELMEELQHCSHQAKLELAEYSPKRTRALTNKTQRFQRDEGGFGSKNIQFG